MMELLLATDLDHTLVGDDGATGRLNQWLMERRGRVGLVYCTGRSLHSARQLQQERALLEPDYWVTAVGTEIYHRGLPDPDWRALLAAGWQRETLVALTEHFQDLIPQPEVEQGPFKVSFFLERSMSATVLPRLRQAIAALGIPAQLVYSTGQDLDILPQAGDKGQAITYLRARLNLAPERTLVCGDSENDLSLYQGTERGVLVSNAQTPLVAWYRQHGQPWHYLACTPYAGGILEALAHFGLE
ncbi:sucrose-phosphate phosphatase [Anthocerotibacter panamensis]|uniref:sucrose-phosphate phosphatase n=1 Tax=Anthocerotibacter panamensis TaxID=2857077 RepID=UPI001C40155D|nr:sucrose-phosphate phosphatase [Anthocerotibacter panamensis]